VEDKAEPKAVQRNVFVNQQQLQYQEEDKAVQEADKEVQEV